MLLSKESIFAKKSKIEKVHITTLGGDVYVKEFVVADRNEIQKHPESSYQTMLIIMGVCDENGERMFGVDDIESVESLPQKVADELLMAVAKHNESDDEKETAKN